MRNRTLLILKQSSPRYLLASAQYCSGVASAGAYLEDRTMFVEVTRNLGLHGIYHTGYESPRSTLTGLGLSLGK